ncbi:13172_t:CDS:2 [Funneliformis caledonium]|uniref:13172_t:CDS:1 n=2 Tax=Funneliformis TaxID=1117308 RepID=A0A9N8WSI0_9GLOM|nr:13172_t:CDS:2 [Funneliformis caledonium]CAG8543046.1 7765_t:CDS:2 [Funneliformis mosseae]
MSFSFIRTSCAARRLHWQLGKVQLRRASSHDPQYNEPGGYLFGEKPLPAGQKRVKDYWENIWIYGMGGSLLMGTIIAIYKPDTRQDTLKKLLRFKYTIIVF